MTRLALGEALNVTPRTADRTVSLLRDQGARIQRRWEDHPHRIRLVLEVPPPWDEHVDPDARLALRLASLALSQFGTHQWQEKLAAVERLASGHMSPRDQRLFEQMQKAVQVHGGTEDPIETPDILGPLLQALEGPWEMELDYLPPGAFLGALRRIVPYALTHDLFSGGTFLLAWDIPKQAPRHFRLNRIQGVQVSSRPGFIPDTRRMALAANYQIGGWISDQEPFQVQLRIHGLHWVQALKEAPPALPRFQGYLDPGGQAMLVSFMANHEKGAMRWILQFGAAVEVLEPSWLNSRIREQLESALNRPGR
ncbi:MAG: WYL domain-containing protein [Holophaga sp.]|nr:WYL domain-containing protein [Holophaga sp.]